MDVHEKREIQVIGQQGAGKWVNNTLEFGFCGCLFAYFLATQKVRRKIHQVISDKKEPIITHKKNLQLFNK
ncbi:MAG: hypothetical protein NW207_00165 [Cytophagales bacterium]|nr:hypothetical protein [Cytophagales bacterium]